ncbi:GSCOCG00010921001-RA-CDS, partial [Cotesia congregata]
MGWTKRGNGRSYDSLNGYSTIIVQLVNHSTILKEAGLQVRVIIGDKDSSMIAVVRADNPTKKFHKLSDKNHLAKNFGKELYGMQSKYKELTRK